jgi:hypothetical protein
MGDNVERVNALVEEDKHTTVTDTADMLDISCASENSRLQMSTNWHV